MSAPVEHLPGCDLQHTSRQRCSTWEQAVTSQKDTKPITIRPDVAIRKRVSKSFVLQLAFAGVGLNIAWTATWFGVSIYIADFYGALFSFYFWMYGEYVLGPLTAFGLVIIGAWTTRVREDIAHLVAVVTGAAVLLSAVTIIPPILPPAGAIVLSAFGTLGLVLALRQTTALSRGTIWLLGAIWATALFGFLLIKQLLEAR